MSDNPYAVGNQVKGQHLEAPEDIRNKIHNGWVAGVIVGALGFLYACWAALFGDLQPAMTLSLFVDSALVFALAFGIYKKSRVSAVLMLLYFAAGRVYYMYATGEAGGVLLMLIFLLFFYQAAHACFSWHRMQKAAMEGDGRLAGSAEKA